jgi:CDP-2,3-bis-(O-geranylgeranyl)-sn-glycerol synthase
LNSPIICAAFLVLCLSIAGAVHVRWLRSPASRALDQPIDGGVTLRGRRIFGANKKLRGLVAMPPTAALAFGVLGGARPFYPEPLSQGLWALSPLEYALLGFASGLAFMLAELPNSFLKRQFDVAPGAPPLQPWLKPLCATLDRVDSTLGVLLVVTLAVPTPLATWGWALLFGTVSHALFSHWLYRVGEKSRPL